MERVAPEALPRQRISKPIETLLQWAYRDELPKSQTDPTWATMFASSTWQLGARIDRSSTGDSYPAIMGAPHPDALLIDHAVGMLSDVTMPWEDYREIIVPDLLAYCRADDPALARMQFQPKGLIMMHAKMGTRPRWQHGELRVECVLSGNRRDPKVMFLDEEGNETAGSRRGNYYSSGACCPIRITPPPREIACARGEYFVWYSALLRLTEMLNSTCRLSEHSAVTAGFSPAPWGLPDKENGRVLYVSERFRGA